MDRPKGHPTDEDIIEMYWERDENAIRATDRKYGRLIFGLAFGILADKCDSEECRNDTYLLRYGTRYRRHVPRSCPPLSHR